MSGRQLYPDWPFGGVDVPTVCAEKSLTRQSEAEGCDVNFIMRRYEKTGVMPVEVRERVFADVSAVHSFREALEVVQGAQEVFYQLPAKVRERFGNNAVDFVDFCSDPANRGELEDLGLVEKAEAAPVVAPGRGVVEKAEAAPVVAPDAGASKA